MFLEYLSGGKETENAQRNQEKSIRFRRIRQSYDSGAELSAYEL